MCIQTKLQEKIAILTNDGEDILRFLAETMRGETPGVKTCHRLEASRQLTRLNTMNTQASDNTIHPVNSVRPEPVEGQDHADADESHTQNPTHPVHPVSPTPTLYDIVAYPIARYIRDRTNDGETLIEALRDVIHDNGEYDIEAEMGIRGGTARPSAKPHHKLAAANEIIRRALGESSRRRKSSAYDPEADLDDSDPLNGQLAKLVRDKTADGTEGAEILIRIAENDRSDGEWTSAHRVSAARELLHRAYDLNYDAVTWEHVAAYKSATDFADEGESLERTRIQNGRHALLREYKEAYESGDEEAAQRAEDKYNAYNRYISEGKDPEEAMKYATYGPDDPDPDPDDGQDDMYAEIHRYRRLAGQDDASDNRTVAATVRTPKLTIPLKNRSP